jgi:UDP-N-acetylglucosamine--N-acetylmuramyl-(pentapeptide) pyrophosphoryl-undecaprenol N-acetylglucosamine transferase
MDSRNVIRLRQLQMSKYVFAGGGTAGHVLPSVRVALHLRARHAEIFYVGSANSFEESLCAHHGIPFHAVTTAKFDRSRKLSVITALAANVRGILQARRILRKIRPHGIFTSGGFASVPVVIAGRSLALRSIIVHACDLSLGLANTLCLPFASRLSCTFEQTVAEKGRGKAFLAGPIVEAALLQVAPKSVKAKPQLLVYGGSQGSKVFNAKVRASLDALLVRFDIVHVCGKGNIDPTLANLSGYRQYDYVMDFMDILKSSDIAICRAGSNSLWELILTRTPHLAVPLPASISRGDQLENCKYFEKKGATRWMPQPDFEASDLASVLAGILDQSAGITSRMAALAPERPAVEIIADELTKGHP